MWVARNKNNDLILYVRKPYRDLSSESWEIEPSDEELKHLSGLKNFDMIIGDWVMLDSSLYPNLVWEDEPEEVFLVMKNSLHKITCNKCGKEFKYHTSDIKEWHDCQPSSGYDYGAEYVNCPHCEGYNELSSW